MKQLRTILKKQLPLIFCTLLLTVTIFVIQTPLMANAEEVTAISVDTSRTDRHYTMDTTISQSDVYLFINQGTQSVPADSLPDVQIDQRQNDQVGWKTVTVSYAGKTATYTVKVSPKTPGIYAIYKIAFDQIKVYSTKSYDVDGANFRARLAGSTTPIYMGLTTKKSQYSRYYDTKWMLKPGNTYYVKVRTYKVVNGTRYYSAWSSEKKVTIPKLYGAEAWRYEAKRQLLKHGVYSKYRLDIIVNIIKHESGGSQTAGQGNYYVGLMQFGSQWKHSYSKSYFSDHGIYNFRTDNRLSGSWSLHRVAHLIKYGGGTDVLKQHWAGSWDK